MLIEDSIYPQQTEVPITTKWIETDEDTMVKVPTVDSITGDKLTAFAPDTIGIPYFKGPDKRPFSMEICKQLFDLSRLFGQIQDLETVATSFQAFATREIKYRNPDEHSKDMKPNDVLRDTIDTCRIIATRGAGNDANKAKFSELQKGIIAFGTGFLMEGNFRIDNAIPAAARVAYLAAKILVNDLSPLEKYEGQDIKKLNILEADWKALNRLKRQPDKSSFYYWYRTVIILNKDTCMGTKKKQEPNL